MTVNADFVFHTFEQDTAGADIIFIGRVDSKAIAWGYNANGRGFTNFQIITSFKGCDHPNYYGDWPPRNWNYVSIFNANSSCNIGYQIDSLYLVFASWENYSGLLWSCDSKGTDLLSNVDTLIPKLGPQLSIQSQETFRL